MFRLCCFSEYRAGSMCQGLQGGAAAFRGALRCGMCGPTEGIRAHWASHSSSETSSGGTVRVLLARMLLMLVKERRFAIPIRLTPVPSRFTWARCMFFKNFKPEENIAKCKEIVYSSEKRLHSSVVVEPVTLELNLTAVCDPRTAEIKFNKLMAADQTPPHYCVSHLSAG